MENSKIQTEKKQCSHLFFRFVSFFIVFSEQTNWKANILHIKHWREVPKKKPSTFGKSSGTFKNSEKILGKISSRLLPAGFFAIHYLGTPEIKFLPPVHSNVFNMQAAQGPPDPSSRGSAGFSRLRPVQDSFKDPGEQRGQGEIGTLGGHPYWGIALGHFAPTKKRGVKHSFGAGTNLPTPPQPSTHKPHHTAFEKKKPGPVRSSLWRCAEAA